MLEILFIALFLVAGLAIIYWVSEYQIAREISRLKEPAPRTSPTPPPEIQNLMGEPNKTSDLVDEWAAEMERKGRRVSKSEVEAQRRAWREFEAD